MSQGCWKINCSRRGMQSLYYLAMPEIEYPCFLQGSASKGRLLERFRETPNAVLFATASFWQGVDVRGEQLSCVIVDKLPFAVPTDPIVAARQRHIEDEGGSSFFDSGWRREIIVWNRGLGSLLGGLPAAAVLALFVQECGTRGLEDL